LLELFYFCIRLADVNTPSSIPALSKNERFQALCKHKQTNEIRMQNHIAALRLFCHQRGRYTLCRNTFNMLFNIKFNIFDILRSPGMRPTRSFCRGCHGIHIGTVLLPHLPSRKRAEAPWQNSAGDTRFQLAVRTGFTRRKARRLPAKRTSVDKPEREPAMDGLTS
jgi:hypothetical protein